MSRPQRLVDRRLAKAIVLLQTVMVPVVALLAWAIQDLKAAQSAALGAFVCWLASSYFCWQSFRVAGARASQQILSNMYRGMIGKFAIVVVGFIIILSSVKTLSPLALICGFMLVQSMSWIAPIWLARLQKQV
ncbi:ATP synthase subunit I [Acinetobacter larvae]|uniref:F0F1 ATP synthase subunit I n=1 Tax=Acinetobacter larvae TaxID=1789224 RepID=A0A1B2LVY4_9GAMM|nr:ATP synthase subunit I [Acinetobacter larvae]AOA57097.1 F0F1 ATP synthase subunit I [Acinetobacter larvae]